MKRLQWDDPFCRKYAEKLDVRWGSMQAALNLFLQRSGKSIVETGCQRLDGDWGGGCSTSVFADFAEMMGLVVRFTSIDIDPANLATARSILDGLGLAHRVWFDEGDSVELLRGWAGGPIDLLYLDSFDYPYGRILEEYGGKTDLDAAIAQVKALSTQQVLGRHGHLVHACQEHCLFELKAAWPELHEQSIVLIDDNNLPGGGKPRLAKQFLADHGWINLIDAYQTLWIKP